jgi:hypothetical protein
MPGMTIQAYGRQQIHIENILPEIVGERFETSRRRIAGAEIVDENVNAAPVRLNPADDGFDAACRTQVRLDPHHPLRR